jgi:hypothetical protein
MLRPAIVAAHQPDRYKDLNHALNVAFATLGVPRNEID